ncbi:hypothetical protein GG496_001503 [Candidatus Fervidibacteria bacterium JGI MDM2 JNZ-1-D12]
MILKRLREIATDEANNILSEVCNVLDLVKEDEDMELGVNMLSSEFVLFAKCKHCSSQIEIATLPYGDKEKWLPTVSKAVGKFEDAWVRHLARHFALKQLREKAAS